MTCPFFEGLNDLSLFSDLVPALTERSWKIALPA